MGTKAIFKIYNEGKFVIGSWVKWNGGVDTTSIFPFFLKNLKYDFDKKSFYDLINKFVNDNKFNNLTGLIKNKPFSRQMDDNGMTDVDVLFWETSLSDKKLMENDLYGEYTYEVRFTKNKIKIKVIYNGHEKTYELKGIWGTTTIIRTIDDMNKWVDDIEYGLNDCNCGEQAE